MCIRDRYEQYLVENITGGSSQDLILMSTQEDGSVQIELLTADREGSFRQVAVNGLSADKFSGCASVAAGAGADGRHYLPLIVVPKKGYPIVPAYQQPPCLRLLQRLRCV